jgi:hypothetical protein
MSFAPEESDECERYESNECKDVERAGRLICS